MQPLRAGAGSKRLAAHVRRLMCGCLQQQTQLLRWLSFPCLCLSLSMAAAALPGGGSWSCDWVTLRRSQPPPGSMGPHCLLLPFLTLNQLHTHTCQRCRCRPGGDAPLLTTSVRPLRCCCCCHCRLFCDPPTSAHNQLLRGQQRQQRPPLQTASPCVWPHTPAVPAHCQQPTPASSTLQQEQQRGRAAQASRMPL